MADLLTLQLWLAEANIARHNLLTGTKEASVSYDGKSVTFTATDAYRLDAYIADLERQIGEQSGTVRRRGPVQFSF